MTYSDAAIDAALRSADAGAWSKPAKIARVRAKMIAIRDAANPWSIGATPTESDLHLALTLRAKDLLGFTSPDEWYIPREKR